MYIQLGFDDTLPLSNTNRQQQTGAVFKADINGVFFGGGGQNKKSFAK